MKKHVTTGIFLIFACLTVSLGFFGGYYAMQNFFSVPEAVQTFADEYRQGGYASEPQGTGFADAKQAEALLSAKAAPAAVRLDLFYVLREEPEAVISVLDTVNGCWRLYTLPADTHVALGEARYRRLAAQYPALPQLFEIGVLTEYMETEQAAQALSEALSDILFCTFQTAVTCTEEELSQWCVKNGEIYVLAQETAEYLSQKPVEKRAHAQLALWGGEEALCYAETLAMLEPQDFTASLIAGERENDGYYMDVTLVRRQLGGGDADN